MSGRLAAIAIALLLAACAGEEKDPYVEKPVETLYNSAMNALEKREFAVAAKLFDEVERQHPYSAWATRAQLMAAFSQYERNAYDDAIVALDRFIQLHPSNRDTPYAYYLKALCYYEQISDVSRDQKMTQQAVATLGELVRRFPTSTYARDAKIKLDLTNDHLAGKEMNIGRWYQQQGQYLAAINRFKALIDGYQTTTHVPEALMRLIESYMALGLKDDARRTAAILGHNFPGNVWYEDAFALVEGGQPARKTAEPWYKIW